MRRFAIYALALCAVPGVLSAQAMCADDRVLVAGGFGQAVFTVDLADDEAERMRGLMFVEDMPRFGGMLFVYDQPQRATFWMRNTLISLDMIFAAPDGTITHIHENAIPEDLTTIDGGDGVLYVLEINGGMADMLGISVGDALQHPSIGEDAALPCP